MRKVYSYDVSRPWSAEVYNHYHHYEVYRHCEATSSPFNTPSSQYGNHIHLRKHVEFVAIFQGAYFLLVVDGVDVDE